MKIHNPSFFEIEHFLEKKQIFSFLPLNSDKNSCHICYNVNDSYFKIMGSSIVSILDNNKDLNFIIHIFTDGYTLENERKVKELARKWNCCCILYTLNMQPFENFHIKVKRFSGITYGRIYMPEILKHVTSRYIYIDSDTMCISSLRNLWNLNLKGKAIGVVSESPASVSYRAKFLKLKNNIYFNDGIMLVDIGQWKKQNITEKAFSYQNEPKERFLGHDQDVLNIVMDGNVFLLPSKYNAYGGGKDYLDCDDAVIVHWTGRRKPWQMVLTKFDQQWRHYNALSPWETITNILPVKKPENYHDFQHWGKYQKRNGHMSGYLKGMFWYSWLRIRYKMGL